MRGQEDPSKCDHLQQLVDEQGSEAAENPSARRKKKKLKKRLRKKMRKQRKSPTRARAKSIKKISRKIRKTKGPKTRGGRGRVRSRRRGGGGGGGGQSHPSMSGRPQQASPELAGLFSPNVRLNPMGIARSNAITILDRAFS
jgi:hypothetical protein